VAAPHHPAARGDYRMTAGTRPESAIQEALRAAIGLAQYAPSLHHSQPWAWRIAGEAAELSTAPHRSIPVAEPSGRDTMLGCGAALHHARTALAAAGWGTCVTLLPDATRPALVARIELTGRQRPHQTAIMMAGAISRRHTDPHPFGGDALPVHTVVALRSAVEQEGCRLVVTTSEDGRSELAERFARPERSAPDGLTTSQRPHPRAATVPAGMVEQRTWAILYTDAHSRAEELRAGQGMSALMLTATSLGVALTVQSQPVEVAAVRIRAGGRLLHNLGYKQFVVRLGRRPPTGPAPEAIPRRSTGDVPTARDVHMQSGCALEHIK
jgi:hypothetical protein